MSYKVAIVGTKMVTAGFAAMGCEVKNVSSASDAKEVLFQLKAEKQTENKDLEKYAIIFVLEEFIKELSSADYNKLSFGTLPAIISIPSSLGSTGFGATKIKRIVEKAVGADIFK